MDRQYVLQICLVRTQSNLVYAVAGASLSIRLRLH